jgi:hypothetical protein
VIPVAAPLAHSTQPVGQPLPAPDKSDLDSIVSGAGLQWVETKSKQLSLEDGMAAVPAPRPVRVRKPRAVVQAEPLQQVETRPGDEPK